MKVYYTEISHTLMQRALNITTRYAVVVVFVVDSCFVGIDACQGHVIHAAVMMGTMS